MACDISHIFFHPHFLDEPSKSQFLVILSVLTS
jgi:hypothetical protein